MTKALSLLLAITLIFAIALPLASCNDDDQTHVGNHGGDGGGDIVTPEFIQNDRGTVKFEDVSYSRPNAENLISEFNEVADSIAKKSEEYEALKANIMRLDDAYIEFSTMLSYANIQLYRDTANEYWTAEYEYLSSNQPALSKAIENLLVAAAQSPDALLFEEECFGEGLIEEYADGGIYTDELVSLLEEENELENRYSTLSTATVTISYRGRVGSFDEITDLLAQRYGEGTSRYREAFEECLEIYEAELARICSELLVDLIKVRRRISDELGYESYATYAYENLSHDYSPDDTVDYIIDAATYVFPVYMKIMNFTSLPEIGSASKSEIMNDLYYAYADLDEELGNAFSYMLHYNLYDCAPATENRFDGAFTTYLDYYNAPFVFATLKSSPKDYSTLSHEFGHFYDAYVNYNSQASLDLSEVSSTALEYITLITLGKSERLTDKEYKYLTYSSIEQAMNVLIFQGFFALFEHYAYELDYNEISSDSLTQKMHEAALDMGLNPAIFPTLDSVTIPHVMLYPFYVQSYCTSTAVALEIYYLENETSGAGLEAYKKLIAREDDYLSFEEHLERAGLQSPFEDGYMLTLANRIHYAAFSKNYFETPSDKNENLRA